MDIGDAMSKFPKNVGDIFRKRGDSRPVGSMSLARPVARDTRQYIVTPCGGGGVRTEYAPTMTTDNLDTILLLWEKNGVYSTPYTNPPNGQIYAMVEYTVPGSSAKWIIAGGAFTNIDGQACSRVAAWDGVDWNPLGDGFNSTVWALAVHNGVLYAGGQFIASGATSCKYIAKYDYGTGTWGPCATNDLNNHVLALASAPNATSGNDKLVMGGKFTLFGANNCRRLGTYDDGTDTFAELGFGCDDTVYCAISCNDDEPFVVFGGDFLNDAALATSMAKIGWANLDTGAHGTVGDGANSLVRTLCRGESDRVFYLGGSFYTTALGAALNYLAKCDWVPNTLAPTDLDGTLSEITGTRDYDSPIGAIANHNNVIYVMGRDLVYAGGRPAIRYSSVINGVGVPAGPGLGPLYAVECAIVGIPPALDALASTGGGRFVAGAFYWSYVK